MTNLFKKSVLAVALFATAGAQAANFIDIANPVGVSKQAANAVSITGSAISINPAVDYPVDTVITITFSGGELSVPGSIASVAAVGATAVDTTTLTGNKNSVDGTLQVTSGVTFTLVSATTNQLKFKVAGGTLYKGAQQTANTNDAINLSGYQFTSASLASVNGITATVAVTAPTGALNFDPVDSGSTNSLSRTVLIAGDQFAGSVTAKTYKIDLASSRSRLDADTAAGKKNVEFITVLSNRETFQSGTKESATVTTLANTTDKKVRHTVTGDFSFVTDTNTSTIGIQPASGAFSGTGCALVSLTSAQLVYDCETATAANAYADATPFAEQGTTTRTFTLDLEKAGASATQALSNGTYSISVVQDYTGTAAASMSLASATAVTLNDNGTTKSLDYVPYGADITQIIYLTNLTDQVGKISVTAWDQAGTKVLNNVVLDAKTKANGITELSTELAQKLGTAATGKYRFQFSAETSSATLYGAYKVGTDRAYVVSR